MSVVKLDDHRPHEYQYVACMECGYDWVAVMPCALEHKLECSECGKQEGEVVDGGNMAWFRRFMSKAMGPKDQRKRSLVLLNQKLMKYEGVL